MPICHAPPENRGSWSIAPRARVWQLREVMVRPLLARVRRRLLVQAWVEHSVWGLCIGLAVLAIAILWLPGVGAGWLAAIVAAALLGAGAWSWLRRPGLEQTAAWVDARAATRDRLSTALAFEGAREPLQAAAVAECERYLQTFDPRAWTPWRLPRGVFWLLLPVLALAGLQLWVKPWLRPATTVRVADVAVLEQAARLETLARELEAQNTEKQEAAISQMAEAFRKSAERLREGAAGEAPGKAALEELSSLEEWVRATRQKSLQETLAEAFEGAQVSKPAAEALRSGDAEAAARALEELAQKVAAAPSQMEPLRRALRAAAEALGEQTPAGEAAAEAAKAASRKDAEGLSESLSKMSQALRNPTKGAEGSKLISALQEMKNQPGKGNGEAEGEEPPSFSMAGAPGKKGDQPAQGEASSQGGQPGSEQDSGSKQTPWGDPAEAPGNEGEAASLESVLGEGESLQTLISAQAGDEKAKAGYRALYEAAAPAAQDALERENIPLGSRLFIKRYFESIRPTR